MRACRSARGTSGSSPVRPDDQPTPARDRPAGDGLGTAIPPQVTSVARKPLSIAFEEIAAHKIRYERPAPDAEGDEVEAPLEAEATAEDTTEA